MAKPLVHPGDRFLQPGNPPSRWLVEKIVHYPGMPDHVRLVREGNAKRSITIAISELADPSRFRRLQSQA